MTLLLLTDTLYDNYKRLCEIYNNYFLHLHAIQSIMSLYTSDWSYSSDHNIFSITVCTGCMRSLQSLAASFTRPTYQIRSIFLRSVFHFISICNLQYFSHMCVLPMDGSTRVGKMMIIHSLGIRVYKCTKH